MSGKTELNFANVRQELLLRFPELQETVAATLGNSYDLAIETPDAYPIFEDVVKKKLFQLIDSGEDSALLRRLFDFFEDMANSPDPNVSRDLLGIAILEPLVYRTSRVRLVRQYMKPQIRRAIMAEALSQGKFDEVDHIDY
jgi:hypothetical protein